MQSTSHLQSLAIQKPKKQRTIEEIIEKVSMWRKLIIGIQRDGELVKYKVDQAADMVGVPKKTLDDYLLKLRKGKKYGFDFQEEKQKKVGVLNKFIEAKEAAKAAQVQEAPVI